MRVAVSSSLQLQNSRCLAVRTRDSDPGGRLLLWSLLEVIHFYPDTGWPTLEPFVVYCFAIYLWVPVAGVEAVGATRNCLSHTHRWVAHHLQRRMTRNWVFFFLTSPSCWRPMLWHMQRVVPGGSLHTPASHWGHSWSLEDW